MLCVVVLPFSCTMSHILITTKGLFQARSSIQQPFNPLLFHPSRVVMDYCDM